MHAMTWHRKIELSLVITIAAPVFALPQAVASRAAFDVVSIRPNRSIESASSISRSGGRITFANVSLREFISFAYGIAVGRDYELVGPWWLDSEKFDFVATCPPETTGDVIRQMSQGFLAERFGLSAHLKNKTIKAYALISVKAGAKLQPSTVADPSFWFGEGHITARGFSMVLMADRLSGPVFKLDKPVRDMTAVKGFFDFDLDWVSAPAPDTSRPSIFTALQEQLGLKLETRSLPVGVPMWTGSTGIQPAIESGRATGEFMRIANRCRCGLCRHREVRRD
jgi:uncharacterized protein (TIGR03435 family)